MAVIRKFMFETEFDVLCEPPPGTLAAEAAAVPEPEPEPEPEPPEPTFSAEELALAREQAHEVGRAAGRREAEASQAAAIAAALDKIAAQLAALHRDSAAQFEAQRQDALHLALAVVERALPALAARHGMGEIEALFGECMAFLADEPRINMRVSAGLLEEARARLALAAEASGFEGRLSIHGDPDMALGDCRIEWAQGGAERDLARLWREARSAVEQALGIAAPPDVEHCECGRQAPAPLGGV